MANSLTSNRRARYSLSILLLISLTYSGYYTYSHSVNMPTAEKNKAATAFFNQGNQLYKEGKYQEAIERYHEAIKLVATNKQLHINVSLAAIKMGDIEHAIEHAQKALIIDPNYSAGHVMLGNLLEDKKQFADAKKAYEKALSINENLFEANVFMARLLLQENDAKNSDQAIIYAKKAVALQPTNKDSLITLGDAYFLSGQIGAAREQYQAIVNRYPQAYDALVNLGKTYEYEQKIDKALPYYEKAVSIKPDYTRGQTSLAQAESLLQSGTKAS
jgi:tetratricopeptide (TPR) repeat protein